MTTGYGSLRTPSLSCDNVQPTSSSSIIFHLHQILQTHSPTFFSRCRYKWVIAFPWKSFTQPSTNNPTKCVSVSSFWELHDRPNSATVASLLKQCAAAKNLLDGRLVHSYMRRHGYDRHTFLGNCLVHMYGCCGSMEDAQTVFDNILEPNSYSWNILFQAYAHNGNLDTARMVFERMPQRDVVSWNSMISACAQNERGKEALQLFLQMQLQGILPDKVTMISVLDACTRMMTLDQGKEIHAIVIDKGCEHDVIIGTALVTMYGKCGRLGEANNVFCRMPQRDVVCWSAMIVACAGNGCDHKALDLFCEMQHNGIKPDKVAFICVLDACTNLAALQKGQEVHVAMVHHGYKGDLIMGNALVSMYGKCGSLDDAWRVFQGTPQWDLISWNAMIEACLQNKYVEEALHLFCQMQLDGIQPDKITLICALEACASLAALEKGQEIHAATIESGYQDDVAVATALVHMYGKCRHLDDARNVFGRMHERDVICWNAMLAACAFSGHGEEALDLFGQMQLESASPDNITFMCVLETCTNIAALEAGKKIHADIIYNGYELNNYIGTALVNLYGKCGSLHDAMSTFRNMPQCDVVSWSAMIAACVQNRHDRDALDLFYEMQDGGLRPDNFTFTSALDACASLSTLEEGQKIHSVIVDSGSERDVLVDTTLVNMYGKCGSIQDAKSVFYRMPERDIVSWNVMIAACAQNGHCEESLHFFHEMQLEGIMPDEVSFICVLTACNHTGRVDDGQQHFISMKRDYGMSHTLEHYVCLVDLLGRAGHLHEAEDLIDFFPFDKVSLAWSSLLGACSIHGDVDRGERAANHYFQFNPDNAALYITMSNIYAAAAN